jgi:hypothetical protein
MKINVLNENKTKELEISTFNSFNGIKVIINDTTYHSIEITNKKSIIDIIEALNEVIEKWEE